MSDELQIDYENFLCGDDSTGIICRCYHRGRYFMKVFYVSRDLYEQGREGIEAAIKKNVLKWAMENIAPTA